MKRLILIVFSLIHAWPLEAAVHQRTSSSDLQRALEERDAQIDALVKRVELLEQQKRSPSSKNEADSLSQKSVPPVSTIKSKASSRKEAPSKKPVSQGLFEVDEDAAQRALERTLVISGAILVPYGQGEVQPAFNYLRYSAQGQRLVQSGGTVGLDTLNARTDMIIGSAFFRLGLPFESQLEGYVPYESVSQTFSGQYNGNVDSYASRSVSGFGDYRLGLAKTLLTEQSWWPDIIARITWDTAYGRTPYQLPIGDGFNELQGSITVTKRQDPLVFFGTGSYQSAFSRNGSNPGDILGVTIGTVLGASPETSIRFFLNQNFIANSVIRGVVASGTSFNSSTLNIGASTVLGKGFFMDFTSGVGLTRESPDYSVGASFAYRFDLPFMPEIR